MGEALKKRAGEQSGSASEDKSFPILEWRGVGQKLNSNV
jgi:hypothetical protein